MRECVRPREWGRDTSGHLPHGLGVEDLRKEHVESRHYRIVNRHHK